jgi:phthalate 4,5-dioxygenase oxygenase subunit
MYAAIRGDVDDPGQVNMRISQFLMPFWTMPPINSINHNFSARGWVPLDDDHHMLVIVSRKDCDPLSRANLAGRVPGAGGRFNYRPNSTDWLGRWRLEENRENDYGIDRERQRRETFTGIEGITLQDHAVTESMGGVSDRTLEHLAPSDSAITQTRRYLMNAARDYAKDGTLPVSAARPEVISSVRGGFFMAPTGASAGLDPREDGLFGEASRPQNLSLGQPRFAPRI